jgi:hypothetical protein
MGQHMLSTMLLGVEAYGPAHPAAGGSGARIGPGDGVIARVLAYFI